MSPHLPLPCVDPLKSPCAGSQSPSTDFLQDPHPMATPVPSCTHASCKGRILTAFMIQREKGLLAYEGTTSQFGPNGLPVTRPLVLCYMAPLAFYIVPKMRR
jgi:hypothetical protein